METTAETPIECISAVTLATRDMPRAVEFYEALRFTIVHGGSEATFTSFEVGAGFLNIQLVAPDHAVGVGWGRIVFWVVDVDEAHARAVAAGLAPLTGPADAPWGERYFHIRDPDGHELSFARPLST